MSSLWALSGVTKVKARSSTGCLNARMSSRGFQGGHNAGHTLVIDGKVYKLNALPSGVVRGGKLSVIGNGVVLDPWHLVKEIDIIRGQGVDISPETLMIAENTPIDPADPR